MKTAIIFDLDGTLTDSGEGIINCAMLALSHFDIPLPSREAMRVFVGPPLRDTFSKFGVPEARIEEAIRIYRSRYIPIGIYENTPYPGIKALLSKLQTEGYPLYVATSKPETMAVDVLTKFGLSQYFDAICGATMDGTRDEKSKVIAYLLDQIGSQAKAVMVGDTYFDVIGAAAHNIPTVGVSWGYGSTDDMLKAGAVGIAATVDELHQILTHFQ